ncbi:MAG: hypothetical protein ABJA94_07290 [Rhodoglobus sp.]
MNQDLDQDSPLDPAAMLALVEREQSGIPRQMARRVPWILLAWGLAWFFGFGMLWLIDGAKPWFSVPLPVGVITFAALLAAATAVSAKIGSGVSRGIRTNRAAAFTGTVFGITSFAGFIAVYIFAIGLSVNGMPESLQAIYFPTAIGIIIGLTYLFAGAIWHAVPSVVMGGLLLVVALIAPFFGYPNNYLFFAVAGGAVFFGGALSVALYTRGRVR